MAIVYVYPGAATFTGEGDLEWRSPQRGARHKLMLFLSQQADEAQGAAARAALARFGFSLIELGIGKRLLPESLDASTLRAFHDHYEEALEAGSSVVWHPEDIEEDDM